MRDASVPAPARRRRPGLAALLIGAGITLGPGCGSPRVEVVETWTSVAPLAPRIEEHGRTIELGDLDASGRLEIRVTREVTRTVREHRHKHETLRRRVSRAALEPGRRDAGVVLIRAGTADPTDLLRNAPGLERVIVDHAGYAVEHRRRRLRTVLWEGESSSRVEPAAGAEVRDRLLVLHPGGHRHEQAWSPSPHRADVDGRVLLSLADDLQQVARLEQGTLEIRSAGARVRRFRPDASMISRLREVARRRGMTADAGPPHGPRPRVIARMDRMWSVTAGETLDLGITIAHHGGGPAFALVATTRSEIPWLDGLRFEFGRFGAGPEVSIIRPVSVPRAASGRHRFIVEWSEAHGRTPGPLSGSVAIAELPPPQLRIGAAAPVAESGGWRLQLWVANMGRGEARDVAVTVAHEDGPGRRVHAADGRLEQIGPGASVTGLEVEVAAGSGRVVVLRAFDPAFPRAAAERRFVLSGDEADRRDPGPPEGR